MVTTVSSRRAARRPSKLVSMTLSSVGSASDGWQGSGNALDASRRGRVRLAVRGWMDCPKNGIITRIGAFAMAADLEDISIFYEVARAGSITAAARRIELP